MKKLAKRITGKEWSMILITVLFTCCFGLSRVRSTTYVSKITELLGTPGTELGDLWSPATKMMGLSFLAFLSSVTVGFLPLELRHPIRLNYEAIFLIVFWITLRQKLNVSLFLVFLTRTTIYHADSDALTWDYKWSLVSYHGYLGYW